jgi:hypothetical protein
MEKIMAEEIIVSGEKSFNGMNAEDICSTSYGKKLDCKKNVLEYIERVRLLSKEKVSIDQLQGSYCFIEKSINEMKDSIKPNTVLQLKKELDAKLGKFAPKKSSVPDNHFLKFFMEAYPKNKRYKDYTWVIMDLNKISDDQILHTLKYINAWCFKNKLSSGEKKDISQIIQKLVTKGNLKYINQVRSLEGLMRGLHAKIIENNGVFNVELNKKKTK